MVGLKCIGIQVTSVGRRVFANVVSSYFVYGTLKRGQCRDHCWPTVPLSVRPVWARGQLFSRHDYPALIPGNDKVLGELWDFQERDVADVITTLDRVEGTNQPGQPDLFRRDLISVFDFGDELVGQAFVYLYDSRPESDGFTKVVGDSIEWPNFSG